MKLRGAKSTARVVGLTCLMTIAGFAGQAKGESKLIYVMDIVNHGSSVPVNYQGVTGVNYPTSGPGMLTPFGMRQMHMRGREIRRLYVENAKIFEGVANPLEYYAYAVDTDRTLTSAQAFMTGLFQSGVNGPPLLVQNQTAIAVPPISVEKFSEINATLNMQALVNNFQTVPIHSDAGNLNSSIFQGYDPVVCPIIGEIQMYNLASDKSDTKLNDTFTLYQTQIYQMFASKKLALPPKNGLTLEDYRAMAEEVLLNERELRYIQPESRFNSTELQYLLDFLNNYYYQFLFSNKTVVQLATTDFFHYLITNFDERAQWLLDSPSKSAWAEKYKTQSYHYVGLATEGLAALVRGLFNGSSFWTLQPTTSMIIELYQTDIAAKDFDRANYFVNISWDGRPMNSILAAQGVQCVATGCSWDSLAAYLSKMMFAGGSPSEKQAYCFSHLLNPQPDNGQESAPWWLAVVISIPLVVITVAVIKIAHMVQDKKALEKAKKRNYANLEADQ